MIINLHRGQFPPRHEDPSYKADKRLTTFPVVSLLCETPLRSRWPVKDSANGALFVYGSGTRAPSGERNSVGVSLGVELSMCKCYIYIMQVLQSALKHGCSVADVLHAYDNALRLVEYEYHGEDRLLIIGPDRAGNLLEVVAVPTGDPTRIIHADTLRPKFYDYLR